MRYSHYCLSNLLGHDGKITIAALASLLLIGLSISCSEEHTVTFTSFTTPAEVVTTVTVTANPDVRTITALPTLVPDSTQVVKSVEVELGTNFVVVFHSTGGSPHNFQEIYDASMLTLIGKTRILDFPVTPGGRTMGGGGYRDEFTFKAIKAGVTTLSFLGYNVWQTTTHETLSYEIYIR